MRATIHPAVLLVVAIGCRSEAPPPPPPGDAAAVESAPVPTPPPEPLITVEALTARHFHDGEPGQAAQLFASGDWRGARAGFASVLENGEESERDQARIRFLVAWCDTRLGRFDDARLGFARAAVELPHLADLAHYQASRAAFAAGEFEQALELAGSVAAESEEAGRARLLQGKVLRRLKRWSELVEHYERYLHDRPGDDEARFRLAEAMEKAGRPVPDAIDQYRRITVTSRRSKWGKKARKRLKSRLRRTRRKLRWRYRALNAGDYVERGLVRYRAREHTRAAREFKRALAAPRTTPRDTCKAAYYLADSWFRHRDRKRAAERFDQAFTLCGDAGLVDRQIKAAYQAGRAHAILGDWEASAKRFEQAEAVAAGADHTFADDARLFRAEAATMQGKYDESRALLSAIPTRYPRSDMRAEARWQLSWLAYREGDYSAARDHLREQLSDEPLDADRTAHARAQYWLGRVLAHMNDGDGSVAAYEATVRGYPLTYYALLALNRLREEAPDRYRAMVAEITGDEADPHAPPSPLKLRVGLIDDDPQAIRAFELFGLGLHRLAEATLFRRGRGKPGAHEPAAHVEALWVAALFHHQAERYPHAIEITRRHAIDYKRSWPAIGNRGKWTIAYPRVYEELMTAEAAQYGYPIALQLAIVREESSFNPDSESRSNAVGLSQLILPTARRFGRELKLRATKRTLRDPRTNLAIGARYISELWTRWGARAALVPPGYNAGEGAVSRWIAARGEDALDEWVEAIPTDQARGYTRRVLSSYFAYAFLADGTVPVVTNEPAGVPPTGSERDGTASALP